MKRHVWLMGALVGSLVLMGCAANPPTAPTQAPAAVTATAVAPATSGPVNTEAPASATKTDSPATPATPEPELTVAPDTTTASVLPAVPSVWNTTIGPDNMTGECAKGSVLPVYGLVQVTPLNDTFNVIEWKNQEPKPYTLKQVQADTFSYAGPTSIDDGTVTMTVTFENATTFKMVRQFVSRADPGCTHTHDYAGEFKWTR